LCHFSIWLVLRVFNIDNFGIARAEVAEFAAYSSGIVFAVEQFSLLVISRPLAVAAGVPTGDDPCIRPGAKCDAVGHGALSSLPPFKRVSRALFKSPNGCPVPNVGIQAIGAEK
jgi:hypothetical protein